jgi:hypothetical protein
MLDKDRVGKEKSKFTMSLCLENKEKREGREAARSATREQFEGKAQLKLGGVERDKGCEVDKDNNLDKISEVKVNCESDSEEGEITSGCVRNIVVETEKIVEGARSSLNKGMRRPFEEKKESKKDQKVSKKLRKAQEKSFNTST